MYVCTFQKESSRGRHREKEDIKITKERTPESEEENVEWETNRDGEFQKIFVYIVYLFLVDFVDFLWTSKYFSTDLPIVSETSY